MLFVGSHQSIGQRNHCFAFVSASVTSKVTKSLRQALHTSKNLGHPSIRPCNCCAPRSRSLSAKEGFADFDSSSERALPRGRAPLLCSKCRRNLRNDCSPLHAHNSKGSAKSSDRLRITSDKDVEASYSGLDDSQGLEAGVIPESRLLAEDPSSTTAQASTSGRLPYGTSSGSILYPPAQRSHIRESWCSFKLDSSI